MKLAMIKNAYFCFRGKQQFFGFNLRLYSANISSNALSEPSIAIIGSGPSAFYTAQSLLKVDIFEKMPAPFGLVRYGVAPDHPEVKNVINTFNLVAQNKRFNFYGNVAIGKDIKMEELRKSYTSVVLAYGASIDNMLDIPGEFKPDLNHKTVVVIGIGNVALDVARILLSPIKRLQKTDIPKSVEDILIKSKVEHVIIISRRGPFHVAFTIKEFRELANLPGCCQDEEASIKDFLPINFLPPEVIKDTIKSHTEGLPRPRKRLLSFLKDVNGRDKTIGSKLQCSLKFLRSPIEIVGNPDSSDNHKSCVKGIKLSVNELEGDISEHQKARVDKSKETEFLECGVVIRSVGYRSIQIDPDIPFDNKKGVIKCDDLEGRVAYPIEELENSQCSVYAVGWAKRGAKGVIVDTAVDARLTAEVILKDLAERALQSPSDVMEKRGGIAAKEILVKNGVKIMSFNDWGKIDAAEKKAGESLGKPREKITSIETMLKMAFSEISRARKAKE